MFFCGPAKWVILSNSWKKSTLVDFPKMLKNLLEGQQESSKVIN